MKPRISMNRKKSAAVLAILACYALTFSAPASAGDFFKKLLQGGAQDNNAFQTNQFGQPYSGGYGYNNGMPYNGGNFNGMPYSGGFNTFQGGSPANLNSSLNQLDTSADQLSKRVEKFLQSSGRWFPQPKGNDMQVCVAMQAFKQQLSQIKRGGGNMTPQLQMQLMQLQQSANNLTSTIQVAGMDPGTRGQAQMLRDNVSQMMAMSSITPGGNPQNPFWNMGQPYSGFGGPMLHVNQSGRGALTVMGQQYMRFRDVSLETIDPVSRRVRASFSGGRDNLILSGPITQQTMNGVSIAVDSSDKGAISGTLNVSFASNGSVGAINSSGQMNGQGYAIQFNGN